MRAGKAWIALVVGLATLLSGGGLTASAAETPSTDTVQTQTLDGGMGVGGDTDDTGGTTATPKAGDTPSAKDDATTDAKSDATPSAPEATDGGSDAKTGDAKAETGQAAPKATAPTTPQTKADTKATTPDTAKGRQGTLDVEATSDTSLKDVTTRLYRIGDWPAGMTGDKAKTTSWDDLHATASDPNVAAMAAKAYGNTKGDPVDAMWHDLNPVTVNAPANTLAAALKAAGVSPVASVTGTGRVTVPEGVYLAVPENGFAPQAVVGTTTLDGASTLKDKPIGFAVIDGASTVTPLDNEDGDDTAEDDSDTSLLGRMMSLFRLADPLNKVKVKVASVPRMYHGVNWTGKYIMADGATALCIQANKTGPGVGAVYVRQSYSGFSALEENRMRAAVYYAQQFYGPNIDNDYARIRIHHAFSYIHNGGPENRASTVGFMPGIADAKWQKYANQAWQMPLTAQQSHVRLTIYVPANNAPTQQLVSYQTGFRWQPTASTQAQANSGGWKDVNVGTRIDRTQSVRDNVVVKSNNGTHVTDDYFTIVSELNVDVNNDGRADYKATVSQIENVRIEPNRSYQFSSPAIGPRHPNFKALNGYWPSGAHLWWVTSVRPAQKGDPGYSEAVGRRMDNSYMVNPVNRQDGRTTVSENFYVLETPSIDVSTKVRNATNGGVTPANNTDGMMDHISIAQKTGNSLGDGLASADTRLVMDLNHNGKADTGDAVSPWIRTEKRFGDIGQGDVISMDTRLFTPADLKQKTWATGVTYWFDTKVYVQTGNRYPTVSATLSGAKETSEQFQLWRQGTASFSTVAQGIPSPLLSGGSQKVKDQIRVTCTEGVPANTTFTGTITFNAPNGKSKAQAVTMKCGTNNYSREFAPSDVGMATWAAGKYWFDLTVPKQKYVERATTFVGKTDANESWTLRAPKVTVATRAVDPFDTAGGTAPVKDLIWTTCENIGDNTSDGEYLAAVGGLGVVGSPCDGTRPPSVRRSRTAPASGSMIHCPSGGGESCIALISQPAADSFPQRGKPAKHRMREASP
ncbi:hypothetical protein [Bifidobacterium simiarum]|uniref:hypothetical protein n=1 Tax=Bifidobacterium simiarum TaxID=2045441 RepID=UPI0013FD968A|nr:hypothetical protein [Bifidobacterium simiarum]